MIYKLRADREKYLCFDIDAYAIELRLGDYFLLDQPLWADFWKTMEATFYEDSDDGTAALVPDITVWGTQNCLALSQKAYSLLRDDLSNCGEFLPATCEGIPYWVFHSTTRLGMNCVDPDASDRKFDELGFIEMLALKFKEDALKEELIFQTEFNNYRNMYCTERFKKLIVENGLVGLRFSEDLACLYEP